MILNTRSFAKVIDIGLLNGFSIFINRTMLMTYFFKAKAKRYQVVILLLLLPTSYLIKSKRIFSKCLARGGGGEEVRGKISDKEH